MFISLLQVGHMLAAYPALHLFAVYSFLNVAAAKRNFPTLWYAESLADAVRHADVALVLTEGKEFVGADPEHLAQLTDGHVIIDGRNNLDAERWTRAGWDHRALGHAVPAQPPKEGTRVAA
ncbi:hypothetical protein J7E29_02515 [Streptomyces sp. ISL-90]|nr:hypothetical protein [Streptomyces sp. ISL-90]